MSSQDALTQIFLFCQMAERVRKFKHVYLQSFKACSDCWTLSEPSFDKSTFQVTSEQCLRSYFSYIYMYDDGSGQKYTCFWLQIHLCIMAAWLILCLFGASFVHVLRDWHFVMVCVFLCLFCLVSVLFASSVSLQSLQLHSLHRCYFPQLSSLTNHPPLCLNSWFQILCSRQVVLPCCRCCYYFLVLFPQFVLGPCRFYQFLGFVFSV